MKIKRKEEEVEEEENEKEKKESKIGDQESRVIVSETKRTEGRMFFLYTTLAK